MSPPTSSSAALSILLATLVAFSLLTVGVAGQSSLGFDEDETELESDDIVLTFAIDGEGSATVTLEHRYRLADNETEIAFEDLRSDIETNQTEYIDRFESRMSETVDAASTDLDREMAITDVSIDTETRALPLQYGIITYTFEWHGFAVIDGDRVYAGDAIGGMFLDSSTRLQLTWPETHQLDHVTPEPTEERSNAVVWIGPIDFTADQPRIEVVQMAGDDDDGIVGSDTLTLAILLVGLVGFIAGIYVSRSRWRPIVRKRMAAWDRQDDDTEDPPKELLSNEEKVLRLIEEHDGRMKQQEVVQTLDWSDARTSQVVRELRESGEVESFRIGRENVLRIPEEDDEQ